MLGPGLSGSGILFIFLVFVCHNLACFDVMVVNLCQKESFKVVHMAPRLKKKEINRKVIAPFECKVIKNVNISSEHDVWIAGVSWRGSTITGALAFIPRVPEKLHYYKLKLKELGHYVVFIKKTKKRVIGGTVQVAARRKKEKYMRVVKYIHEIIIPSVRNISKASDKVIGAFAAPGERKIIFDKLIGFSEDLEQWLLPIKSPSLVDFYTKLKNKIDVLAQEALKFIKLTESPKPRVQKKVGDFRSMSFDEIAEDIDRRIARLKQSGENLKKHFPKLSFDHDSRSTEFSSESSCWQGVEVIRETREPVRQKVEPSEPEVLAVEPFFLQSLVKKVGQVKTIPVERLMRDKKILESDADEFASIYDHDALEHGAKKAELLQESRENYRYTLCLRHIAKSCNEAIALKEDVVREVTV